jgi:DNA-binding GntR family transcriptional regulator
MSYTPRHIQAAEQIRRLIKTGAYQPGETLPSTRDMSDALDISVITVRKVLTTLAAEHLIVMEQGKRARVAEETERRVEQLRPGERVTFRRASAQERQKYGLPEGDSVAVITALDGSRRIFPAYEVELWVVDDDPGLSHTPEG